MKLSLQLLFDSLYTWIEKGMGTRWIDDTLVQF